MNRYLKEIIWLCVPIILVLGFTILLFGINALNVDSLDINIGDTYYVFSPFHFVIALAIIFLFIVYAARILHHFFKNNKTVNYTFLVFQGLFIIAFSYLMMLNYDNSFPIDFSQPDYTNIFDKRYPIAKPVHMAIIQYLLILLLIYSSIKVGRKHKKL